MKRQEQWRRQGRDLAWLAQQVAPVFGLAPDEILRPSKRPPQVAGRSVFCFWAVRDLGVTATAVARALGCTQSAVSIAMRCGEQIANSQGLRLAGAQSML